MSIIILIVGVLMIGLGLWQPIKNHFAKKRGEIIILPLKEVNYNESPFKTELENINTDPTYSSWPGNIYHTD